jgi:hypothetical protein
VGKALQVGWFWGWFGQVSKMVVEGLIVSDLACLHQQARHLIAGGISYLRMDLCGYEIRSTVSLMSSLGKDFV